MKFGIDASRARSGGAHAHLVGVLSEFAAQDTDSSVVFVWAPKSLLSQIPDCEVIVKKTNFWIEQSLFFQMFWQAFLFKNEFADCGCDVLLNIDGACLNAVKPCVTMSRDMLSYEKGELERYSFGFARLRLLVLRYVQNFAFRRADGVIFLTHYARNVIQKSCGLLSNTSVIPHGVDECFRFPNRRFKTFNKSVCVRFLYVSNVDFYKHQWNVVRALELVRREGWDCRLTLVGGGGGPALKRLGEQIKASDPNSNFVEVLPFLPHKDIVAFLKNSDVFIFASSCENMPNSLIEAMAAKSIIACSNRGPMPEVLKDGGFYFDPESFRSIYECVISLLENNESSWQAASNSYEISEHYSWGRCAEETFNYLRNVHNHVVK